MPTRFRVFTTASTPLASSKTLSAAGESTKTQSRVSTIADANVGEPDGAKPAAASVVELTFALGVGDWERAWRDMDKRSKSS